jgi:hypothetical protein
MSQGESQDREGGVGFRFSLLLTLTPVRFLQLCSLPRTSSWDSKSFSALCGGCRSSSFDVRLFYSFQLHEGLLGLKPGVEVYMLINMYRSRRDRCFGVKSVINLAFKYDPLTL